MAVRGGKFSREAGLSARYFGIYFGNVAFPLALAEAKAPAKPNCDGTPSMRWVELRFFTTTS